MRIRAFALALALVAVLLAGCGGSTGEDDAQQSAPPTGPQTLPSGSAHPVAGDFKPSAKTLADCKPGSEGLYACLEQAYGNLAYTKGPKLTLKRFAADMAADSEVERDCHRIVHNIGSASLARNKGDVGRTFAEGDSTCWSGYYHGILERALKGATEDIVLKARVRALCKEVLATEPTFTAYQCVHGLGHGLMIRTGLDLPYSLKMCESLATPWEQTSCDGGVFMENFNTSYGVQSRFLKDDQPLYPCTEVAERHKLYCYLQITDRVLQLNGYDFAAAGRTCLESEREWVATCFQSYGRSASGTSRLDQQKLLSLCGRAPATGQPECVFGAVRDIASNDAGGKRAMAFCGAVRDPFRGRCFYGLGTILNDLGRLQECALVPSAYRPNCRLRAAS
ncbi:MAG TPA: hypothetical protein VH950_11415 [Gaiellaceae bacterium]|jgi:hypothetical protein